MKKTINVNLAGRIFYVEEDAYAELDRYLQEVKLHFSKFEDSAEILADIEARIAEQLLEAHTDNSTIVTKTAVEQVIRTMGKPSDFADAEDGLREKSPQAQQDSHTGGQKRLYRNSDDHMLGGVASGIASYFDTDALWIRLLFVASTFLGGYGVLIYVVLWIIVPKATTLSEKLEMNGSQITLESLEKSIKEKIIHNPKTKQGVRQAAEAFRPAVGKMRGGIGWLVQTILRVIGAAFFIGATIGIIALVVGSTAFVTGSTSAYAEFPLRDFLGLPQFYAALFALFFIAFVPLLFLLLAGLSLVALRSRFSRPAVVALMVLWVTAASVTAGLAAHNAPRFGSFTDNHPAYQVQTVERSVKDFDKLVVSNGLSVELIQGDIPQVIITAVQQDLDRVHSTVINNTLTVQAENSKNHHWCFFCMHSRPRITITVPALTDIHLENGVDLKNTQLKTAALRVVAQNGSRATFQNVTGTSLHLEATNASSLTVAGKIGQLTSQAENASFIKAGSLLSNTATAQAKNASRITLQVSQTLDAHTQNGSRVYYVGTPEKITGTASPLPEREYTASFESDEYPMDIPQAPLPAKPAAPAHNQN